MKTHEFARHLEQLARFLRQLPNAELDSKRPPRMQDLFLGVVSEIKDTTKSPKKLPTDISERLAEMSPAEIESFLLSDKERFTSTNLSEIAEQIGITSSKRQSKIALVNMIVRHYEASKMHNIIRSSGPAEG